MSRLLHAAARGARIQSQWRDSTVWQRGARIQSQWRDSTVWQTNNQFVFIDTMRHYRIHPDDEHLQYGPISTEVRKAAETIAKKAYLHDVLGHYGLAAIDDYLSRSNEFGYCWGKAMNATAMQKQLFLLFLAECLADSGL